MSTITSSPSAPKNLLSGLPTAVLLHTSKMFDITSYLSVSTTCKDLHTKLSIQKCANKIELIKTFLSSKTIEKLSPLEIASTFVKINPTEQQFEIAKRQVGLPGEESRKRVEAIITIAASLLKCSTLSEFELKAHPELAQLAPKLEKLFKVLGVSPKLFELALSKVIKESIQASLKARVNHFLTEDENDSFSTDILQNWPKTLPKPQFLEAQLDSYFKTETASRIPLNLVIPSAIIQPMTQDIEVARNREIEVDDAEVEYLNFIRILRGPYLDHDSERDLPWLQSRPATRALEYFLEIERDQGFGSFDIRMSLQAIYQKYRDGQIPDQGDFNLQIELTKQPQDLQKFLEKRLKATSRFALSEDTAFIRQKAWETVLSNQLSSRPNSDKITLNGEGEIDTQEGTIIANAVKKLRERNIVINHLKVEGFSVSEAAFDILAGAFREKGQSVHARNLSPLSTWRFQFFNRFPPAIGAFLNRNMPNLPNMPHIPTYVKTIAKVAAVASFCILGFCALASIFGVEVVAFALIGLLFFNRRG